jgi:hypothetical protein
MCVCRAALSDTTGVAQFVMAAGGPEYNHLVLDGVAEAESGRGQRTEKVRLTTLDECMKEYGWQRIDFLKIDAEGAELNIIQGGRQFFEQLSPLVMFEVEHAGVDNVPVTDAFTSLGYSLFRLVPALCALVAVDPVSLSAPSRRTSTSPGEPKDLNLFAAKADCAEKLAARGLLIRVSGEDLLTAEHRAFGMAAFRELPHARALRDQWAAGGSQYKDVDDRQRREVQEVDRQRREVQEVEEALSLASFALLPAMGYERVPYLGLRYMALLDSYQRLDALCAQNPTPLRICSLQRVARSLFSRAPGVYRGDQAMKSLALIKDKELAKNL